MNIALLVVTAPSSLIVHAIQDVAPFLPLITTGLCESHVTAALDHGLLYPAAAGMTIFGSLGIAMAGAIALLASIDWPFVHFHGPTHLKNAGLQPTGLGTLLLHVSEQKHHLHVAEDRLRTILSKKKVRSVNVNLLSPDLLWWNIRLVLWTAFLSTPGMIPYVPPFIYSLPDQPFHETWLAPLLRVFGSAVVAVSVQFLFQLRLLEEAYHRLRFLAADTYLKDAGTSLPPFWDPNQRSKSVFAQLGQWLEDTRSQEKVQQHNGENPPVVELQPLSAPNQELKEKDAEMFLKKIRRLRSFNFECEKRPAPSSNPSKQRAPTKEFDNAERGGSETPSTRLALWVAHRLTTFGLCLVQLSLLLGVGCIVYGYVLCFSLVQANRSSDTWVGPVLWIVFEIVLALVRIAIWASNPEWDDPRSPIVLEKVYDKDTDKSTSGNKKCSYGIGWSFSSLTADDMHALVIGIDSYQMWGSPDELCELSGAVSDATDMAKYLEEKLRVPCHQIRTLYNSDATKERIVEELKGLNHRVSVAKDAPIVIYYAGHSQVSAIDNCTYLVPSLPNVAKKVEDGIEGDMLKYGDIVELLRQIGNEKTDNIVLILDTCHAGAMAQGGTSSTSNGIPRSPSPEVIQPAPAAQQVHEDPTDTASPPTGIPTLSESGSRILRENEAAASHTGSPQIAKQGPKQRSTARSRAAQAKARDILTGHPSHVLLAAAAADQQAYESTNGKGGQFTAALLYVLSTAEGKKNLKTMTYKDLIGEVSDYDVRYGTVEKPLQTKLGVIQRVHCTTIHQERPLFDGLFARKRDDDSAVPVVTVQYYSD